MRLPFTAVVTLLSSVALSGTIPSPLVSPKWDPGTNNLAHIQALPECPTNLRQVDRELKRNNRRGQPSVASPWASPDPKCRTRETARMKNPGGPREIPGGPRRTPATTGAAVKHLPDLLPRPTSHLVSPRRSRLPDDTYQFIGVAYAPGLITGVRNGLMVGDPQYPSSMPSTSFLASWVMVVGVIPTTRFSQVGWAETGWHPLFFFPRRRVVFQYDTTNADWVFFDDLELLDGAMYQFAMWDLGQPESQVWSHWIHYGGYWVYLNATNIALSSWIENYVEVHNGGDLNTDWPTFGTLRDFHLYIARNYGPEFLVTNGSTASTSRYCQTFIALYYDREVYPCGSPPGPSVSLQANNNQYVVAENNGGGDVNANRDNIGPWETFELIDLNGGSLHDGDPVAFRAGNGDYFQAVGGGGGLVLAIGGAPNGWETFTLITRDCSNCDVGSGDRVALQSYDGHYVVAESGGGDVVKADRISIGAWEEFRIITH